MTTNITNFDKNVINSIYNLLARFGVTNASVTKQDYGYDVDLTNDPNWMALNELSKIDGSDNGENICDNAVCIQFHFGKISSNLFIL